MVYIIETTLQLGLIYSLVALSLFLSYRLLKIADLTTDGCFVLGMCVSLVFTNLNHPLLGVFTGMLAGGLAGLTSAFLQTKLGVPSILSGIVTNTALYTINLMVMGFGSNIAVFKKETIFTLIDLNPIVLLVIFVFVIMVLIRIFLITKLGLSIRATGDNPSMVSSSSINPCICIQIGLVLSNMLTGLSGAIIGQLQRSGDINAGNGVVTIGLATLIIGETLTKGKKSLTKNILACLIGNIIYRLIYAFILQTHIIPIECLKLFTALVITLAIAIPYLKDTRRKKDLCLE